MSPPRLPELFPAPPALDTGDGQPLASGRWRGPIEQLSTACWDRGGRRRLQRKGWMYFSAATPRFQIGYAIVDAGLVATAFVYVFDRASGRLVEEKAAVPFGFAADHAPDWRTPWRLAQGARRWSIEPDPTGGWQVDYRSRRLQLALAVTRVGDGLSALTVAPQRPFHHTWKLAALPGQLRCTLDGEPIDTPARCALDFTLGYPPRSTQWNWASLAGQTEGGTEVGVNLVAHFMNGLENALWLGDALIPLAQATFDYDRRDPLQPWQVRSVDGLVDIRFEPQGQRRERFNAVWLHSRFTQPFGRWQGRIDGEPAQGHGVVEDHRALW